MKKTTPKATKTVYPIICQIVNTIPTQFVAETAKAHRVLSRTFSPKSPVAAMLYCQVSKTESLNSICDVARANDALWRSMDVTPPMRNTLSNANAHRPSGRTKDLYWKTLHEDGRRQGAADSSRRDFREEDADTQGRDRRSLEGAHFREVQGLAPPRHGRRRNPGPDEGDDVPDQSRLAGVVRGTLWIRRNLVEALRLYGTAGPVETPAARPKRLYFQAVLEFGSGAMGQQTC